MWKGRVVKSSGGGKTAANQNMKQALDIFLKYVLNFICSKYLYDFNGLIKNDFCMFFISVVENVNKTSNLLLR